MLEVLLFANFVGTLVMFLSCALDEAVYPLRGHW